MSKDKRKSSYPSKQPEPGTASSAGTSPAEPSTETSSSPPSGQSEAFYLETIESLRKERDEYHDLLLRKQAELENFRKRSERERQEARLAGQTEALRELLHVLDACEKGLQSMEQAPSDPALESFRQGYELLLKQLKSILERFNVTETPGVGSQFDPNVHEAVFREVTADEKDGVILEEYRKGYLMGDRLLRPSQVKVAVHPEQS